MKTKGRHEHQPEHKQEIADSAEFHKKRMSREQKIERKKCALIQPEGNDEYEQLVAENADFNTKPMIEEAAYLLAERRGFAPGNEVSDWLQAEAEVEGLLRGESINRRSVVFKDRREIIDLICRHIIMGHPPIHMEPEDGIERRVAGIEDRRHVNSVATC